MGADKSTKKKSAHSTEPIHGVRFRGVSLRPESDSNATSDDGSWYELHVESKNGKDGDNDNGDFSNDLQDYKAFRDRSSSPMPTESLDEDSVYERGAGGGIVGDKKSQGRKHRKHEAYSTLGQTMHE